MPTAQIKQNRAGVAVTLSDKKQKRRKENFQQFRLTMNKQICCVLNMCNSKNSV